ncbi:GerAB/ArcD/ProY family transporter [Paenibacillus monticola]|uniref:GerAB/ArcD/ProY family transporter n=1 Tax=Paenibacillus monticola TaxID=2666075 RepID=A0A7X2H4U3_9BACL|nr:GerAB/ArcD/ProY family transporter [Paenibacillus monticola]MRN53473.1 GerAB/ArcD/ProY family transporter [Paenibacillus monticola]
MRKELISANQLFAMIILFEMGTALVVPIGLESGHAVWISILLALPGGVLLYLIYSYLYQQYPNMIISGYTQRILGRFLGWPLSLLYIPIFMYNGSRNLREAGDLLIASSYDQTPIFIINAMMITAVIYVLNKGLEVFSRTAEIYLLIILGMGLICCFVVIAAGLVEFENLFPIHAKDWRDALTSAYPSIWTFPYGELVCFTTILPHINKFRVAQRTGIAAIILSGLLLSFTHAIEISVLGTNIYARATFPLFTTITLVNLANFIQRLDALVILTLIIGVFFKMTIYCYAAMTVTADLFKVKDARKLAVPIGIVVLFSSFISAENYPIHLDEGKVFMKYILTYMCAAVPILLFIVHYIRKCLGLLR